MGNQHLKINLAGSLQFYYIAMGSLREAEAIILMEEINDPDLLLLMDQLGGALYKLCKSNTPYLEK